MEHLGQILGLATVFGLLAATLWVLKTKGLAQIQMPRTSKAPRRIQLLERLPLTPQHSVCLLRVDSAVVAVCLTPGGCQILPSGAQLPPISCSSEPMS